MMLTQRSLKEVLFYDAGAGVFIWRKSLSNRAPRGSVAGYLLNTGYWEISIFGKRYLGHHLAWLYVTGSFPPNGFSIDHIDRCPENNAFNNLRLATVAQNNANRTKRRDCSSGFKGVSWDRHGRRWRARITRSGKQTTLGYFKTPEEAHSAYGRAAAEYFGEFAVVD